MGEVTVYELIGVHPTASDVDLRRAYHAKVRELHPDRNKDPNAQRELGRINTAWQSVNQPDRRAAYDLWITSEAKREERVTRTARVREARLEREDAANVAAAQQRAKREAQREEAMRVTLERQEYQRRQQRIADERATIEAAMAAVHAQPEPPSPPPKPSRPRVKKETVQRATKVALDILDAFLGGKK